MSEIRETALEDLIADLNVGGSFRVVDESGNSRNLLKTLLTLPQAQIVGLVAALADKVGTPDIKSQLGFIKADGTINGSGMEIKTLTTEAQMNLAFNGRYNFLGPGLSLLPYGNVQSIEAWDDSVQGESNTTPSRTISGQLICSSNGLFYRKYSGSAWGQPVYIGGSSANYTATRLEAIALITAENLTPGITYRITDHGNDDGLILEAATSTTFNPQGLRLARVPAHYLAGTYSTVVWIGVWRITIGDAGVAAGNKAVFMGRVWTNLTGNIGTVKVGDAWSLDATNWALSVEVGDYVTHVHQCVYDFDTDYISSESDDKGNTFGEALEPTDGFLVEYNDWNIGGAVGCTFTNNKVSRLYNIRLNSDAIIISYNIGNGSIHSCDLFVASISGMELIFSLGVPPSIYNLTISEASVLTSKIHGAFHDCSIYAFYNNECLNDIFNITDCYIYETKFFNRYGNKDMATFSLSYSCILNSDISILTFGIDQYIRDDLTPPTNNTIPLGAVAKFFSNLFAFITNTYFVKTNAINPTDLTIQTGAGKTLVLETPVYEDINTAIANGKASPANYPTWAAFDTNLGAFTFALNDYLDMGTVEIPHSYLEGSNLEVHLHLATNGLNNATERKVKYTIFFSYGLPDNGANIFTAEASLTAELTIPANQSSKSAYYLSMGTITGTGIKIGTQLKMRVKRIAGTGTEPINDPFLGQVGIHYQKDTLGSRTLSAK